MRRVVLAMSDEKSEFELAHLPTPLFSALPSEFDKLCEKFGGPADLGIPIDGWLMNYFRQCCGEFRPYQVLPVLLRFAKGQTKLWQISTIRG